MVKPGMREYNNRNTQPTRVGWQVTDGFCIEHGRKRKLLSPYWITLGLDDVAAFFSSYGWAVFFWCGFGCRIDLSTSISTFAMISGDYITLFPGHF